MLMFLMEKIMKRVRLHGAEHHKAETLPCRSRLFQLRSLRKASWE